MALPPSYYPRPNSLPKFLLSLLTLFIMLGALPIGVYLVGQRTNSLPQAVFETAETTGAVNFSLEKDDQVILAPDQVAVDLLVHTDNQEANLFATRVNFPSQYLELVQIATASASIQSVGKKVLDSKWIESDFNNDTGEVNLVSGVVAPGIKTEPDQRYIWAKLIFHVKSTGVATFHLDPDSTIFSNLDNRPLEVRKNDLTFELPPVNPPAASPKPAASPRFVPFRRPANSLSLISPTGGETIGFSTQAQVKWEADNLDLVTIDLLINGEKLGQIGSVSAGLGKLDWRPVDFILPTFLIPLNTYQIEISSVAKNGEQLSDISKGPFAIVKQDINLEASQAANLAKRGGDANNDGSIDLTDLSILFSSFGKKDNLDLGVDLNGDGAVNDVDLWLFKGVLLR